MKNTMINLENEGNEFISAYVNLSKITFLRLIKEQYDHNTTPWYVLEIYVGDSKPIRMNFLEKENAIKELYRIKAAVDGNQ